MQQERQTAKGVSVPVCWVNCAGKVSCSFHSTDRITIHIPGRAGGAATKHIRKGEQMAVGVGIVDGSGERSTEDVAGDLFAA